MTPSRQCGSRAASRVVVASPQGSRWNGRVGVVVGVIPGPGTVLVRFAPDEPALPFARSEVQEVTGR